jgi:hypothetical protein
LNCHPTIHAPGYVYQYSTGKGFEGSANVYIDIATPKEVVIKTNLRNSRTKQIPETIRNRLRDEYKLINGPYLNLTDLPVDIDATMRNYNGDNIKDLIIYATYILAFPPKNPSGQDLKRMEEFHIWIVVYPRPSHPPRRCLNILILLAARSTTSTVRNSAEFSKR